MVEGGVPSRLVVEVLLLLVVVVVLATTGALPKKAEPEAGGGAPAASLGLSTHWVHRMQGGGHIMPLEPIHAHGLGESERSEG